MKNPETIVISKNIVWVVGEPSDFYPMTPEIQPPKPIKDFETHMAEKMRIEVDEVYVEPASVKPKEDKMVVYIDKEWEKKAKAQETSIPKPERRQIEWDEVWGVLLIVGAVLGAILQCVAAFGEVVIASMAESVCL